MSSNHDPCVVNQTIKLFFSSGQEVLYSMLPVHEMKRGLTTYTVSPLASFEGIAGFSHLCCAVYDTAFCVPSCGA